MVAVLPASRSQYTRPTSADSPAKPLAKLGRRVVLKNGLLGTTILYTVIIFLLLDQIGLTHQDWITTGLAGLSNFKSKPAQADTLPAEAQRQQPAQAPSLSNLQADQVC